jgi:hypothetical protein
MLSYIASSELRAPTRAIPTAHQWRSTSNLAGAVSAALTLLLSNPLALGTVLTAMSHPSGGPRSDSESEIHSGNQDLGVNYGRSLRGYRMRVSESVPLMLILTGFLALAPARGQKQMAQSPRILSAKTVYFNNETGSDAVGKNALAQLKRWGKFQLVTDRKQADLVFLLSADPFKGSNVIFAGGQTGSIENGQVKEDAVPNYNKQPPTRYAYLTVMDRKTGDNLWSDKHLWGGLLTGFNSVGERLIKELESQTKR